MVQKLLIVGLVLVLSTVAAYVHDSVVIEQTCVDGELIPHDENCQLFYRCADATRQLHSCADGLHFNPIQNQCDWPSEAKCTVTQDTCVDGEFIPHDENCQLFYGCLDARRHLLSCPDGLHFNPIRNLCDFPTEAKCTVTQDTCVDGEFIPHDENCQLFYGCLDARRHLLSCPDGLHFNPIRNLCDFPTEAKCTVTQDTCVDGEFIPHDENCQLFYACFDARRHLQSCPDGLHFNPIRNLCDFPTEAKCTVTQDTCVDGEFIPHDENCQLFYGCLGARRHLLSCPDGLHFNPIGNLCDWPAEAKCAA